MGKDQPPPLLGGGLPGALLDVVHPALADPTRPVLRLHKDRRLAGAFAQLFGGIRVVGPERLQHAGIGQEAPPGPRIHLLEGGEILDEEPEPHAVAAVKSESILDRPEPLELSELVEEHKSPVSRPTGYRADPD